ncbi:MAG TPA: hypothetical protein VK935_03230, partial [Actinomycetospora sp.]|nr:hypothetical protein [Actinomycetospora sp.]
NLLAAGRGTVVVDGARHTVTAPRTVAAAEVVDAFTPTWRRMLRAVPEYVVVTAEAPAPGATST